MAKDNTVGWWLDRNELLVGEEFLDPMSESAERYLAKEIAFHWQLCTDQISASPYHCFGRIA